MTKKSSKAQSRARTIAGHPLYRLGTNGRSLTAADCVAGGSLRIMLVRDVVEPFQRIAGLRVLMVPLNSNGVGAARGNAPLVPTHPDCAERENSHYCGECGQLQFAELRSCLRTVWHRCDCGSLCAAVPVVCHNQCPFALRIVCLGARDEAAFVRDVELLDSRVLGFADRHIAPAQSGESEAAPAAESRPGSDDSRAMHPRVQKALEYIEEHLSKPELRLANVARAVGLHPNYLSGLFTEQVGDHLGVHIARRRVDRSKIFLSSTDLQIKRVAHEVGYVNANWFSSQFRTHTGVSPTEYRRQAMSIEPEV